MIRTSSAATRRARTLAGVVLGAAALTACGSGPAHPGAAAVVGGERISIATLEARVAEVRAATAAQSGASDTERAGLARRTVAGLVLDRVIDQALMDRQIAVTDGEITGVRAADAKLLGGESALESALLAKQGVPATDINAFYREQLGIQKLAAAEGQDARTAAGDAVVRKDLAEAGVKLKIEVNPRYGRWDPQQIGLADTVNNWLPQNSAPA